MALNKNIVKNSGLSTNYSRIAKIAINYLENQCIITIETYISEKFREKAKKAKEITKSINELVAQLDLANVELSKAISEKIDTLQKTNADVLNVDFVAETFDVSLDYIPEDTTVKGFYNELVKLDLFKDATEI